MVIMLMQVTTSPSFGRKSFSTANTTRNGSSEGSVQDCTTQVVEVIDAIAHALSDIVPLVMAPSSDGATEASSGEQATTTTPYSLQQHTSLPLPSLSATPGPVLYRYCLDAGIPDAKKHARVLQGHCITAAMLESRQVSRAELVSIGIPLGVAAGLLPRTAPDGQK